MPYNDIPRPRTNSPPRGASEQASNTEENRWLVINTTTPAVSQDNALSENHEEYVWFSVS